MNLSFKVKDLNIEQLEKTKIKCVDCKFWFNNGKANLLQDFYRSRNIWELIKSKIFEIKNRNNEGKDIFCFIKNGGIIKGAFDGRKCVGAILAGKYYNFPKLKSFDVFPPDNDSIFLGCIYIAPEYRNLGVGKKLLIELEKDLIKEKIKSIEAIGKRLNDDTSELEYYNSPLIPVKFLIKNGFYIKKNNEFFPLLRLDLKSIIISDLFKGKLSLENIRLKKEFGSPVVIKKN